MAPVFPEWITPDAGEAIKQKMREAAESQPTLANNRGMHCNLALIYSGAQATKGFQEIAAGEGVALSAPFFDDHVMNTVLSIRFTARYDPEKYKPILSGAMRGIVPNVTLQRSTKSETAASAVLGGRKHRDQIIGLAEDSRLAQMGLIDMAKFLDACSGPIDVQTARRRIEPTLSCEAWLRYREAGCHVQLGD